MHIEVTKSAIQQVAKQREKAKNPDLMLRVTIHGGGCSGFKYELGFDDAREADDLVFADAVITDPQSLQFIQNGVVNYEQNLLQSRFTLKNPNASASCGCGKSFAVNMDAIQDSV